MYEIYCACHLPSSSKYLAIIQPRSQTNHRFITTHVINSHPNLPMNDDVKLIDTLSVALYTIQRVCIYSPSINTVEMKYKHWIIILYGAIWSKLTIAKILMNATFYT